MKMKFCLNSLIILTAFILLFGCSDSVNDSTIEETSITPALGNEQIPDQTIHSSNYLFSIFNNTNGTLFSIRNHDQSLIAANISEEELKSAYPEAYDELVLESMSDSLNEKFYYDDPQDRELLRKLD